MTQDRKVGHHQVKVDMVWHSVLCFGRSFIIKHIKRSNGRLFHEDLLSVW